MSMAVDGAASPRNTRALPSTSQRRSPRRDSHSQKRAKAQVRMTISCCRCFRRTEYSVVVDQSGEGRGHILSLWTNRVRGVRICTGRVRSFGPRACGCGHKMKYVLQELTGRLYLPMSLLTKQSMLTNLPA
eukprot:1175883-Prorocentrum_minimum.AAC.3